MNPALEIDGELFEYTDFYPLRDCIGGIPLGEIFGSDVITEAADAAMWSLRNKSVAVVNVYRRNPNGSIRGIHGIYKNYLWTVTNDGDPLFRVSERLA